MAYREMMRRPKIVFPDIATTCRFALDTGGRFGANTVYFLPMDDLLLLGILNSRLAHFYFTQTCAALEGSGDAYLRFFGQYMEMSVKVPATIYPTIYGPSHHLRPSRSGDSAAARFRFTLTA